MEHPLKPLLQIAEVVVEVFSEKNFKSPNTKNLCKTPHYKVFSL
jgi:hypothetical protein